MEPKIMENHNEGIIIQHDKLTEEALHGLIEEFVTREGIDTGYTDGSLEENVEMVKRQLKRGDVLILIILSDQVARSFYIFSQRL